MAVIVGQDVAQASDESRKMSHQAHIMWSALDPERVGQAQHPGNIPAPPVNRVIDPMSIGGDPGHQSQYHGPSWTSPARQGRSQWV